MLAMNYCYVVDLENASRIEYVYFAFMLDVQFALNTITVTWESTSIYDTIVIYRYLFKRLNYTYNLCLHRSLTDSTSFTQLCGLGVSLLIKSWILYCRQCWNI